MKNKWTSDQEKAIYSSGGTVLVSAAAGSGKTSVLVQRVINKITNESNHTDIDKLLIVTFTNAAAQEMKNRISQSLSSLLAKDPNNTNLLRQQMLLKCSNIGTIHSFCNTLIKENFHRLNISPNFKVATESDVSLLKEKAIENTFDYFYDSRYQDFIKIMDIFSSDKLKNVIYTINKFMNSVAFPEEWLKEKSEFYSQKSSELNIWKKIVLDYTRNTFDFAINLIEDIMEIINNNEDLKEKYLVPFEKDLNEIKDLNKNLYSNSWDIIAKKIQNFSFSRLKPCKSEKKEIILLKRDYIKDILTNLKKHFNFESDSIEDSVKKTFEIMKILFDIAFHYRGQMNKFKLSKNIVDFNDLERLTLKLLVGKIAPLTKSDIAKEISEKYSEIMIDEYQDINEVQDTIFKLISKDENNLFVVGDVKQSVYKFRQSRPKIFLNKKKNYSLYNGKDYPAKIILGKNFRSKKSIINSVNLIFKCLMSETVGEIDYGEEEMLRCGAEYTSLPENDVCLKILDISNSQEEEEILEAREIARTIKEMIARKYQIKRGENYSDVDYSDFCILLRSFNSHANVYLRELSFLGIPCFSETNERFLSTAEISTMVSLLKIIDNPIDDVSLISVMISPIFGFTFDDLSEIRNINKDLPFYFLLKEYSKNSLKLKNFINKINYYRKISETVSCSELINIIYNETQYPYVCLALPRGKLKKENLLLLRDYAKKYDDESYKGLSGFLNFIKNIEQKNSDLPSAFISSENENAVKILSIHKSKGLEFPVCILAGCSRKFVKDSDNIVLHPNFGVGVKFKGEDGLIQYNNLIFQAINLKNRNENISEEIRVLYVALTRAKQKLIIIGSLKGTKKFKEKCLIIQSFKRPCPYLVQNFDSFLEWILICLCFSSAKRKIFDALGISDKFIEPKKIGDLNWDINFVSNAQRHDAIENDLAKQKVNIKADEVLLKKIHKYADFKYPFRNLEKLPLKIAASKLSHSGEWENYFASSWPAFMSASNVGGTARGTAMHKFMCFADLKSASLNLDFEINRLHSKNLITAQELSLLNKKAIQNFLNSKLCNRILNSKEVLREYRFSVKMPTKNMPYFQNKNYDVKSSIIVQGAMDCAFIEDGAYVIVDYKTDRIENILELYEKYSYQLKIYKEALEKTKCLPVKEVGVYSFFLSDYCF